MGLRSSWVQLYGFYLLSLLSRFNFHFETSHWLAWLYNKPVLDIKSVLVIMGRGFKGCEDIFGKRYPNPVKAWYELGESGRQQIIEYVVRRANRFISIYQSLKCDLPRLREGLQKVVA